MNDVGTDDGYISLDTTLEPRDAYMERTGLGPFSVEEELYAEQVLFALKDFGYICGLSEVQEERLSWIIILVNRARPERFDDLAAAYRQRHRRPNFELFLETEDNWTSSQEPEEGEHNLLNNPPPLGQTLDLSHPLLPIMNFFWTTPQEPSIKTWRDALDDNCPWAWGEVITACVDVADRDPDWHLQGERAIGACNVRWGAPNPNCITAESSGGLEVFVGLGFRVCSFNVGVPIVVRFTDIAGEEGAAGYSDHLNIEHGQDAETEER